jgi:choline dehydrogenase
VTAVKEVLLCAGSVGTTQILQLSGIGNSNDLKSLGIKTIVNNPSVGDNLSDHTLLPNIFSVKDGQSFDDFLRNATEVNEAVQQWIATKTGIFANNVVNNFGFARLPSNATIFSTTPDPAAGPGSPHWEIILSVRFNRSFGRECPKTFAELLVQPWDSPAKHWEFHDSCCGAY